MTDKKESVFHDILITDGEYGELSKIQEELDEAKDAKDRDIDLLVLIELADILGAVAGVAEEKYGFDLEQLLSFSELVRKVKSKDNNSSSSDISPSEDTIQKAKNVIQREFRDDPEKARKMAERASQKLDHNLESFVDELEENQKRKKDQNVEEDEGIPSLDDLPDTDSLETS